MNGRATLLSVKQDDEWPISQNASKCQTGMSLILCRLLVGANKMFIKYVPR